MSESLKRTTEAERQRDWMAWQSSTDHIKDAMGSILARIGFTEKRLDELESQERIEETKARIDSATCTCSTVWREKTHNYSHQPTCPLFKDGPPTTAEAPTTAPTKTSLSDAACWICGQPRRLGQILCEEHEAMGLLVEVGEERTAFITPPTPPSPPLPGPQPKGIFIDVEHCSMCAAIVAVYESQSKTHAQGVSGINTTSLRQDSRPWDVGSTTGSVPSQSSESTNPSGFIEQGREVYP